MSKRLWLKRIIWNLIDAVVRRFPHPSANPRHEYVLLIAFPGRRPLVKAYKLGEGWYAHENDLLSDWRIRLLPEGKVLGSNNIVEGWEPVTPNMVEFYHSIRGEKKGD